MNILWRLAPVLAALLCLGVQSAHAQPYPTRPIRLVLPFPPGGAPDTITRLLTAELQTQLGKTIVIDNRTGANGMIAYELVANAAPDGYTLVHPTLSFLLNRLMHKSASYDLKDFAPVTMIARGVGYLLLVNPSVPAQSLPDLIALSRKQPVRYGSSGVGSGQQLAAELLNLRAGAQLIHVPYKGTGPATTGLLTNEVQLLFAPPIGVLPHVKAGRMRALAITAARRWEGMRDVPTLQEAGMPGLVMNFAWNGLLAPARTPRAIVDKLQQEVSLALKTPRLRDYLLTGGFEPVGDTPDQFRKFLYAELERCAQIVRSAKIQPE